MDFDLISTTKDTLPAWLGGIGGIVSALLAGYALITARRAEGRHVTWQLSNELDDERRTDRWRLINTTDDVAARVVEFENISEGLKDAIRGEVALPFEVAPSAWLPINHDRSLGSPYPTIVRVQWQEKAAHKRTFRRRRYSSIYYID